MKKKLLFGMAVGCSVLLLAGCDKSSNNKNEEKKESSSSNTKIVSCSATETEEGFGTSTTKIIFTYDNSKKEFIKGEKQTNITIEDEEILNLYKSVDMCDEYEDETDEDNVIISCDAKNTDNTVSATIVYDLDKLEDFSSEDDVEFKKTMTPDELIEALKTSAEELECSIK